RWIFHANRRGTVNGETHTEPNATASTTVTTSRPARTATAIRPRAFTSRRPGRKGVRMQRAGQGLQALHDPRSRPGHEVRVDHHHAPTAHRGDGTESAAFPQGCRRRSRERIQEVDMRVLLDK